MLKQTALKSQSVCDCSTQDLTLKFVLKDIEARRKACKEFSWKRKPRRIERDDMSKYTTC